jgi:hypothetical protein
MTTHHHPKGLRTMNCPHCTNGICAAPMGEGAQWIDCPHCEPVAPAEKSRFPHLAQRLSAAIEAGDPVVTDRAIRLARNRGDWQEAERLTADYLRITGQTRPEPRDVAAVVARVPLTERTGLDVATLKARGWL